MSSTICWGIVCICVERVLILLIQLADLTRELMRLAIGRISDGELEYAEKTCQFVRDIYRELTRIVPHMDDSFDMKTKMDTMLQSVAKIENGQFFVWEHRRVFFFCFFCRMEKFGPLTGASFVHVTPSPANHPPRTHVVSKR